MRTGRKYDRPWYELIEGSKPVIAGHQDYLKAGKPTIYKDKVLLIDTKVVLVIILPVFFYRILKSSKSKAIKITGHSPCIRRGTEICP